MPKDADTRLRIRGPSTVNFVAGAGVLDQSPLTPDLLGVRSIRGPESLS
jgi:hypothetical protein